MTFMFWGIIGCKTLVSVIYIHIFIYMYVYVYIYICIYFLPCWCRWTSDDVRDVFCALLLPLHTVLLLLFQTETGIHEGDVSQ